MRNCTCKFARGWNISEGDAEVAKVLVRAIVHRGQVLPLLNWPSKVNLAKVVVMMVVVMMMMMMVVVVVMMVMLIFCLVEWQLELAGLVGRRKSGEIGKLTKISG